MTKQELEKEVTRLSEKVSDLKARELSLREHFQYELQKERADIFSSQFSSWLALNKPFLDKYLTEALDVSVKGNSEGFIEVTLTLNGEPINSSSTIIPIKQETL